MIKRISTGLRQAGYKMTKNHMPIEKFVTIQGEFINNDAVNQMYQARGVLANYAKNKAVRIDIYETPDSFDKGHDYSKRMVLRITNLINGNKTQQRTISSDTNQIKIHRLKRDYWFKMGQSDECYIKEIENTTEDNFLRNLYRNIQEMTEKVRK